MSRTISITVNQRVHTLADQLPTTTGSIKVCGDTEDGHVQIDYSLDDQKIVFVLFPQPSFSLEDIKKLGLSLYQCNAQGKSLQGQRLEVLINEKRKESSGKVTVIDSVVTIVGQRGTVEVCYDSITLSLNASLPQEIVLSVSEIEQLAIDFLKRIKDFTQEQSRPRLTDDEKKLEIRRHQFNIGQMLGLSRSTPHAIAVVLERKFEGVHNKRTIIRWLVGAYNPRLPKLKKPDSITPQQFVALCSELKMIFEIVHDLPGGSS